MPVTHNLESELARLKSKGITPLTRGQIDSELRAHGYRIDGPATCHSIAKYVSGDCSGSTYPSAQIRVASIVSGKGFANIDSPRDENFRWLQANRDRLIYVSRGHIASI